MTSCKQPDIASEFGVLPGKLELVVVNGNLAPAPVITDPANLEGFYPPVGYPINNMGVPGAKVGHLLAPGYGNINNLAAGLANPYFIRMASSPDISVIEQALAQAPTFFSLWIGNNDVLGYASSGGVGDIITPEADFSTYYANLAQAIASTEAKGVLANIPSISGAAYFNTVPGNALQIDAPTAGALNAGISAVEAQVNQILAMAGLDPFSYGITFNAEAIRSWALRNGWTSSGANQLRGVAQAIIDGRQIRVGRQRVWAANIMDILREDAERES